MSEALDLFGDQPPKKKPKSPPVRQPRPWDVCPSCNGLIQTDGKSFFCPDCDSEIPACALGATDEWRLADSLGDMRRIALSNGWRMKTLVRVDADGTEKASRCPFCGGRRFELSQPKFPAVWRVHVAKDETVCHVEKLIGGHTNLAADD